MSGTVLRAGLSSKRLTVAGEGVAENSSSPGSPYPVGSVLQMGRKDIFISINV